jgi:hypothetical protein
LGKIPKININALRFAVKLVSTADVQLLRHVPAIQASQKMLKININVIRLAANLV